MFFTRFLLSRRNAFNSPPPKNPLHFFLKLYCIILRIACTKKGTFNFVHTKIDRLTAGA